MWEEIDCPKCFGVGEIPNYLSNGTDFFKCPICNGFKSIRRKTFGDIPVPENNNKDNIKNRFEIMDL